MWWRKFSRTLAWAFAAALLAASPAAGAASAPAVSTGTVTAVTATSATLTGSVNPEGQSTIYYFQYGPTAAYGSQTPPLSAGSGATGVNVSASVASLAPNAGYHYRLVATNATGTSHGSDASFKTATAPVPAATTGGTLALTSTSAALTGTVNPGGQATTYYFQYGPTAAYGSQTPPLSAGAASTSVNVSAAVGSLTVNTTYHYRLVATNASGSAFGADRSFKTPALRPPAGPPVVVTRGVRAVTATSATLTGSVNPKGQATTYYFQYGPTAAYGSQTAGASAGAGNATVNVSAGVGSLNPNSTYHYRLLAASTSGLRAGADHSFKTARPSAVTLAAFPTAITFGQTIIVGGRVGSPAAAFAAVTLQAAASLAGPFGNVATTTAGAKGAYQFGPFAPSSNTYFRALANGSSSPQALVLVRFRVTLSASTTHPKSGHRVRFQGRVGPRHNGLRVFLQRLGPNRRWHTIARTRLRAAGSNASRFVLQVRVGRSGLYRAIVGPDASHARGSSRSIRIRVHG
jgi:hypothetical protein